MGELVAGGSPAISLIDISALLVFSSQVALYPLVGRRFVAKAATPPRNDPMRRQQFWQLGQQ